MITDGEWEVKYAECPIIVAGDIDIAHIDLPPNGNEEAEDNANLIAAAKLLFRACELTCITCFRKTPEACQDCCVGKAIAAAKR